MNQSPPVRVQTISATPLKHTSPVPVGASAQRGVDDVLRFANLPGTPSGSSNIASRNINREALRGTGATPHSALPSTSSTQLLPNLSSVVDDLDSVTGAFLEGGNAPAPLDLRTLQELDILAAAQILARHNAWQAIANLTAKLVSGLPGDTPSESTLWFSSDGELLSVLLMTRFQALLRLKKFDELQQESEVVLKDVQQRWAQWGLWPRPAYGQLRLLSAEIRSMMGTGEECLEELVLLHDALSEQLTSDSNALHNKEILRLKWRAKAAVIGVAVKLRHWVIASAQLLSLLDEVRSKAQVVSIAGDNRSDNSGETAALLDLKRDEVILLCRLARLYLHQGALQQGRSYCAQAMDLLTTSSLTLDYVSLHVSVTRGLALFSSSDYDGAIELFAEVISKDKGLDKVVAGSSVTAGFFGDCESIVLPEESLYSCAVSGFAICSLHLKNIELSIAKLERLILDNPSKYLVDPVVFNLCTLYDLSCSNQASSAKKQILRHIAELYHVSETLNHRSYRL